MKGQIIKAISEVHSGNKQEAEQIADIVMDLYRDEIQQLADYSDTCVYRLIKPAICVGCRCGKKKINDKTTNKTQ